jgi:hypothetical protein
LNEERLSERHDFFFSRSVRSTTSAAYLIVLNHGKSSGNEVFDDRTDVRSLIVVVDVNADLAKSHERAHSDSAYDEGVHLVVGQKVDRDHASPLNVGFIGNRGYLFDGTIVYIYQRENVTVTKMACPFAVQSAFCHRGNGNSTFFHTLLYSFQINSTVFPFSVDGVNLQPSLPVLSKLLSIPF